MATVPAQGKTETLAAPSFKELAFYNGTLDAAHISFVKEANQWFPQIAAQNNFSYASTNNWDLLNASNLAQYKVVVFLDDMPQTAAQTSAFQQYGPPGFCGDPIICLMLLPEAARAHVARRLPRTPSAECRHTR
jgi:hypothetical protein